MLYTMLSVIVLSVFTLSTASAGAVRISGVSFSLGSLIVTGNVAGLDRHQEAKIMLEAHAILEDVRCVRGQKVIEVGDVPFDAFLEQHIVPPHRRNGSHPFSFEIDPQLDPKEICRSGRGGHGHIVVSRYGSRYGGSGQHQGGQWTVTIGFVNWTSVNLKAVDAIDAGNTDQKNYVCETTPECIECHQVRSH
jgi:hypothetical protein